MYCVCSSDIYLVSSGAPAHENRILKIHRLGRISFRAVKEKRDYISKKSNRQNFSWMYLSRLAAAKEYQFMQILHEHGFPVPTPIAQSRHSVLMSLIDAYPLRQISQLPKDQIPLLYSALMELIVRLARAGLIHGDFNEFNLLVLEKRSQDDEYEDGDEPFKADTSIGPFGQKVGTAPPPQLKPGEKWETGKGFERVVAEGGNPTDLERAAEEDEDGQSDSASYSEDAGSSSSASSTSSQQHGNANAIQLTDGSTVTPILIDFPQMISVLHPDAEYFFNRDVNCVRRFFRKRFRYISEEAPAFRDVVSEQWESERAERARRRDNKAGGAGHEQENADLKVFLDLDVLSKASGYLKEDKKRGDREELDQYLARMRVGGADGEDDDSEQEDDPEEDSDEDESDAEEEGEDGPLDDVDASPATEASLAQSEKTRKSHGSSKPPRTATNAKTIQEQITTERFRLKSQASKHHGKKNQSGKTGRSHAGGKGKSDRVRDNSLF